MPSPGPPPWSGNQAAVNEQIALPFYDATGKLNYFNSTHNAGMDTNFSTFSAIGTTHQSYKWNYKLAYIAAIWSGVVGQRVVPGLFRQRTVTGSGGFNIQ
jgi:hypothetical protein